MARGPTSLICARLRAFVRVYRAGRKMWGDGLACTRPSLPPFNILGSSGNGPRGDAALGPPWSSLRPKTPFAPRSHKQTKTMMDPRLPREAANRTETLSDLQLIINLSFRARLQMSGPADKAIPLHFCALSLALSDTFLWLPHLLFTDG